MSDYYSLLDVPETAAPEQIRARIFELRKTWVKRQNSAQPYRRRAAEVKVKLLDDAERILLDREERRQYDRARASERARREARRSASSHPQPTTPVPTPRHQAPVPAPMPQPVPIHRPGPARPSLFRKTQLRLGEAALPRAGESGRNLFLAASCLTLALVVLGALRTPGWAIGLLMLAVLYPCRQRLRSGLKPRLLGVGYVLSAFAIMSNSAIAWAIVVGLVFIVLGSRWADRM